VRPTPWRRGLYAQELELRQRGRRPLCGRGGLTYTVLLRGARSGDSAGGRCRHRRTSADTARGTGGVGVIEMAAALAVRPVVAGHLSRERHLVTAAGHIGAVAAVRRSGPVMLCHRLRLGRRLMLCRRLVLAHRRGSEPVHGHEPRQYGHDQQHTRTGPEGAAGARCTDHASHPRVRISARPANCSRQVKSAGETGHVAAILDRCS
jgi:hypothetical protein